MSYKVTELLSSKSKIMSKDWGYSLPGIVYICSYQRNETVWQASFFFLESAWPRGVPWYFGTNDTPQNTLSVLMWPKRNTSWISVDIVLFCSMVPVSSLGSYYTQKGKWRFKAIINKNYVEKKISHLNLNSCICWARNLLQYLYREIDLCCFFFLHRLCVTKILWIYRCVIINYVSSKQTTVWI